MNSSRNRTLLEDSERPVALGDRLTKDWLSDATQTRRITFRCCRSIVPAPRRAFCPRVESQADCCLYLLREHPDCAQKRRRIGAVKRGCIRV